MPKPFTSRKYAREDFKKAVSECDTIRDVLLQLGLCADGGNYKTFYRNAAKFGIDVAAFERKAGNAKSIRCSMRDSKFEKAVKNSISFASVLKTLGLNINSGTNCRWVRDKIYHMKLDITHFTGQGHLKGKTHGWGNPQSLKEILIENSQYTGSNNLKKRLFNEGLLTKQCAECGLKDIWNGKSLTLQIDHINGVNNDNRIENLRILCPNCHTQTSTFCSRNAVKPKTKCTSCEESMKKKSQTGICFPCRQKASMEAKMAQPNECNECGATICNGSKTCKPCYNSNRAKLTTVPRKTKINWPSDKSLLAMVKKTNYLQAGKTLGVSDNAIRKRLKKAGLI